MPGPLSAETSDAVLVDRTRAGDRHAYAELWRRYASAGRAAARAVTTSYEPDDLVSEAFARILESLAAGGGPRVAFRAYLVRTIRNLAVSWSRQAAPQNLEAPEEVADVCPEELEAAAARRHAVARAFASLPSRWQRALWHVEVEGRSPRELAPLLGISPNAVSALVYRARTGLRDSLEPDALAVTDVTVTASPRPLLVALR